VSNPPITHTLANGNAQLNPSNAHAVNGIGNVNGNVNGRLFEALLLIAAPTLGEYTATPLFQDALCYSQAAIFTCESSNSFGSHPTNGQNRGTRAFGGTRVQRPDVSTLVLTTSRLVAALEWVRPRGDGGPSIGGRRRWWSVCPREVAEVAEGAMREVGERIEDGECDWNGWVGWELTASFV
jgi:hypothetical protein